MAFQYNHYYEIYNGGKYVNLNGDHENNVVNNGEKVTMYARTNNPDQRWALERYGSDYQVRIVLQRGGGWYALNYNTENTNCIVWHLNSAADKDTVITLEPAVSFGGVYRLKLAQRNLYLTVVGSSLKWMAFTNNNDQIFSFVEPGTNPGSGTGAHTIPMPVNVNQKYRSNSEWIKNWGCAVCCGVDLASWLNKKTYTIDDFKDYYYEDWRGYEKWRGPDGFSLQTCVSLSAASEAETIETIRSYVRNDIPVACHAKGSGTNQHWFVAYEVTGENGSTWDTAGIKVLDPYGKTDSSYKGRWVPILTAMQDSYSSLGVIEIRIPSKE